MAYLTQPELEERFGSEVILQLSDHRGAGIPDAATIAAALSDADAEINGYLGARYALPLTSVPDSVKGYAAVIARYNLWRRNVPAEHPAYVAYRDTLKALHAIATGEIVLPLAAGTAAVAQVGGIAYASPEAIFDTSGLL